MNLQRSFRKWRVRAFGASLLFLLGLILAGGCARSSFSQTYHVGVVDDLTGAVQFYRFEVTGRPGWFSKTKFVSGWYDAEAVASLAGERTGLPGGTDKADTKDQRNYFVTGPEGEATFLTRDKRMSIIMASDPSKILDAIKSFAKDAELRRLFQNALEAKEKDQTTTKRVCAALGFLKSSASNAKAKLAAETAEKLLCIDSQGEQSGAESESFEKDEP